MKSRTGFISNSSSTSFVVAIPSSVKCECALRQIMFPERKGSCGHPESKGPCGHDSNGFSTREAAGDVWQEMQFPDHRLDTREKAIEALCKGHCPGVELDDFKMPLGPGKSQEFDWDGYSSAIKHWAELAYEEFLRDHPDSDLYVFEYSDNDGPFNSEMEHGDIFRNLPHIALNNH